MSLKKKKGALETKLRPTRNEPKFECSTLALKPDSEFLDIAHVSAGALNEGNPEDREEIQKEWERT